MSGLSKAFLITIFVMILGYIFIIIGASGASGMSEQQLKQQGWRSGLVATGLALSSLSSFALFILIIIGIYRVLKK